MLYTEDAGKDLFDYLPQLTKRDDFDEFWQETIKQTKSVPLNAKVEEYNYPSPYVKVYDISYNGFDETIVNGWFIIPTFTKKEKYPCLIHYHGFSGSRGNPQDLMQYATLGIAVLSIDCRDQGGTSFDRFEYNSGFQGGVACRGVLNKYEYYFRAVYMDCLKAIDFVCGREEVDANKIILEGGSQGGALVMAVSALDERPSLAIADIPSNSDLFARVEGKHGAFSAITNYLSKYPENTDLAMETLTYFDTMNMADKITCKVLACVGLADGVCPAKCYFATFNRIQSEKQIEVYPFCAHEVPAVHQMKKLELIFEYLKEVSV